MCDFCTFRYGVAEMSVSSKGTDSGFLWEIRPNLTNQHLLLVRVFKEGVTDTVDKSSIFIKYCPLCGREL